MKNPVKENVEYFKSMHSMLLELLTHWNDPEWSRFRISSVIFLIFLINIFYVLFWAAVCYVVAAYLMWII